MQSVSYKRRRYPPEVISYAVWLYFRFTPSLRDVEELLAQRGIEVSYETIRCWTLKFGPLIAKNLRRRQAPPTGRWRIDEMVIKIGCRKRWLWRAVDDEGVVLDMLPQRRRNKKAAVRLICKLRKTTGVQPETITTDKLASYGAALRDLRLSHRHRCSGRRSNNRGGEQPPADPTTRTEDAEGQERRLSPALPLHPCSGLQHLRHPASPDQPTRPSHPASPGSPDVGGSVRRSGLEKARPAPPLPDLARSPAENPRPPDDAQRARSSLRDWFMIACCAMISAALRSCPWRWCSFERCHRDLRRAGIDQAAMLGRLTTGLSLNVAMVSRLK